MVFLPIYMKGYKVSGSQESEGEANKLKQLYKHNKMERLNERV